MEIESIIQLFAIVLGSNWLGQILMEIYRNKSKKKTPAEIILKSLSRIHLLDSAERYKEQGFIPKDEYDDIFEEFKAYDALGGNGRVNREFGEGGELHHLDVR